MSSFRTACYSPRSFLERNLVCLLDRAVLAQLLLAEVNGLNLAPIGERGIRLPKLVLESRLESLVILIRVPAVKSHFIHQITLQKLDLETPSVRRARRRSHTGPVRS